MSKEKSKNKKKFGSDKYSVENYQNKIITFLKKTEKSPYPLRNWRQNAEA